MKMETAPINKLYNWEGLCIKIYITSTVSTCSSYAHDARHSDPENF